MCSCGLLFTSNLVPISCRCALRAEYVTARLPLLRILFSSLLLACLLIGACGWWWSETRPMGNTEGKGFGEEAKRVITKEGACSNTEAAATGPNPGPLQQTEVATFAAGCFWGVELAFQRIPGVINTRVGYVNGHKANPTYEEVCSGTTGHAEAVEITYHPEKVTYEELLSVLWDRMDPTTENRQGNDVGTQYRSGIYYHNERQKAIAEESIKKEQAKHDAPIVTEVAPVARFWPAEDYHQQYLEKGGQCAAKRDVTPIRCYG